MASVDSVQEWIGLLQEASQAGFSVAIVEYEKRGRRQTKLALSRGTIVLKKAEFTGPLLNYIRGYVAGLEGRAAELLAGA